MGKKILNIRLDEKHPIFKEKNKTKIIEQALDMYYAVQLFKEKGEYNVQNNNIDKEQEKSIKISKSEINNILKLFST